MDVIGSGLFVLGLAVTVFGGLGVIVGLFSGGGVAIFGVICLILGIALMFLGDILDR
jgi:hypothetical protein